ncbi:MAG: 1,4-dihydroxy-6-naphthoate synthase [Saprospiraceae bacterium]|nr:1,4-dihydroxy-6-naphthoate synthase [Candidatus Defluviibacterium haderslevense]
MNRHKNKLSLAISPCPNDTFIFGPWINQMISAPQHHEVEAQYYDIEELNIMAPSGQFDLIKVSAAKFPEIIDQYDILSCGGALGTINGPLLIANHNIELNEIPNLKIALPGVHTTAHFLFKFAFPSAKKLQNVVFSEIESLVLNHQVDAGVIIHENRFTYESKGLFKLLDLGTHWVEQNQLPIPLGLIAIKRSLNPELKLQIKANIQASITFSNEHYSKIYRFIAQHAQELSEEVIKKHIDLYVNEHSYSFNSASIAAIHKLFTLSHPTLDTSTLNFI